jgi:hypothetical protein
MVVNHKILRHSALLAIQVVSLIRICRIQMKRNRSIKYKTSEICSRFDISRATLFRWENDGLLTDVERDWRGWRVYNERNLNSIKNIIENKSAF